jgi:hypothetical protein
MLNGKRRTAGERQKLMLQHDYRRKWRNTKVTEKTGNNWEQKK